MPMYIGEKEKGNRMKCEFEYCIYNRDFNCIADKPEINSFGMCDTCVIVSFDREFLEKEKEKQLFRIENR